MWYLAGAVGVVLVVWFLSYRSGRPDFWHAAAEIPDAAYEWFRSERCWKIVEDSPPHGKNWIGPFYLCIPKLGGKIITVYGKADEIEESQQRFLDRYGSSLKRR